MYFPNYCANNNQVIEKYKKHGKSAWDEAAKKKAKNLAEDKKRRERREKEERELKEASQITEVELQLSPVAIE